MAIGSHSLIDREECAFDRLPSWSEDSTSVGDASREISDSISIDSEVDEVTSSDLRISTDCLDHSFCLCEVFEVKITHWVWGYGYWRWALPICGYFRTRSQTRRSWGRSWIVFGLFSVVDLSGDGFSRSGSGFWWCRASLLGRSLSHRRVFWLLLSDSRHSLRASSWSAQLGKIPWRSSLLAWRDTYSLPDGRTTSITPELLLRRSS